MKGQGLPALAAGAAGGETAGAETAGATMVKCALSGEVRLKLGVVAHHMHEQPVGNEVVEGANVEALGPFTMPRPVVHQTFEECLVRPALPVQANGAGFGHHRLLDLEVRLSARDQRIDDGCPGDRVGAGQGEVMQAIEQHDQVLVVGVDARHTYPHALPPAEERHPVTFPMIKRWRALIVASAPSFPAIRSHSRRPRYAESARQHCAGRGAAGACNGCCGRGRNRRGRNRRGLRGGGPCG
ncbi:hypothetical protein DF3PA_140069 [Candidatus Defluviicoccus seviourii]|uniref:Uncharacterized protein n=1 Tax=Candidatus Defluviicoccus seviourii TaxID=2565273 RepID=A0A564WCK4_9PROT|nr:hypothetical protein DF3PA_140069 [Candidatus Defluviicoccus seviourii]